MSKTIKILSGSLLITIGIIYLMVRPPAEDLADAHSSKIAPQVSASDNAGIAANGSVTSTPTALTSALKRGSASGGATPVARKVMMSQTEIAAHPRFWMLGYSEADVDWLNRLGYPTLVQEEMLTAATEAQLVEMAKAGDLNAHAHYGLRIAKRALLSDDAKLMEFASQSLYKSLAEGNPYHAAKVALFGAEVAKERQTLGEMNPQKLKLLQTDLLPICELAIGLSALYNDMPAYKGFNQHSDLRAWFKLPPLPPTTFQAAMNSFSYINNSRMQAGLPQYPLEQRPRPPMGGGTTAVYFR